MRSVRPPPVGHQMGSKIVFFDKLAQIIRKSLEEESFEKHENGTLTIDTAWRECRVQAERFETGHVTKKKLTHYLENLYGQKDKEINGWYNIRIKTQGNFIVKN